jgi:hypothetical protein
MDLESGVRLFAVVIMALMVGMLLLGYGILWTKVLPPWSVWPLIAGWATFLPMASMPSISGLTSGAAHTYGLDYVAWPWSSAVLLSAGWVTVGYALWSGKGNPDPMNDADEISAA